MCNTKTLQNFLVKIFARSTTSIPTSFIDTTIGSHFSKETYRFLSYLNLASRPNIGQEAAIHDLAKSVLEGTGFDEPGTILRTGYDIPFTNCRNDNRGARTDVCLTHFKSMVLLVVQAASFFHGSDPDAQIIAQAIATFQYNNRIRRDYNLPELETMTIPGIVMIGTRPYFYKVPVTQQLSVIAGQYPSQPTLLRRCGPPPRRRTIEGMEIPDYRRIAL